LEDVVEFFSWQPYGQRELSKQWDKIKKRTESKLDSDYKLAVIDADDFLASYYYCSVLYRTFIVFL
jgi:hypothetical protein